MKKLFLLLAITVIILGSAAATSAALELTIPRYEPYPAQPGEYVDVWLKVQNIGGSEAKNVVITAENKFPFSLDPSTTATKVIGSIRAGQYELIKYKLIVDENAIQGDNAFDITYSFDGFSDLTESLDISVQTHDAILTVTNVTSEPQMFVPGKNTKLSISVKNMDDAYMRDVSIKLGIDNTSLPFAPADSTSEKRIYQIGAGEDDMLVFNILTLPSASGGTYRVPVTIEYTDSTGTDYTKSDIIALVVGDEPQLNLLLDSSEVKTSGSAGTVSVILVNDGLIDLKFLKIKLLESDKYKIISSAEEYIGDLDSDDTDNVDVTVYANKGIKALDLNFELQYLDANNNEFKEQRTLSVPLYTSAQLSMFGITGGPSAVTIIVILAVIGAAGYFVYKKFLKKKR